MAFQAIIKPLTLIVPILLVCTACLQDTKTTDSEVINLSSNSNTDSINSMEPKYIKDPSKLAITYPKTQTVQQEDDYFGTKVKDPYRWLEDEDGKQTEAITEWIDQQNQLTSRYVSAIPYRQAIFDRLKELWDYAKYSAPFKEGDFYYFYKNDGLQNQSIIYQQKGLKGKPKVFIDPNSFSKDGTSSLGGLSFSKDGKYVAYAISASGSDWRTVKVMETATGKVLSDKVDWIRYSGISWYKDGFYYSRYDKTETENKYTVSNQFHQVYYHKLGTSQEADLNVYNDHSAPNRRFYAYTTEDENYLILSTGETTSGNGIYYQNMKEQNPLVRKLIDNFDNDHSVIDNEDKILYILTNHSAPNYRLVAVDLEKPEPRYWKNIIPETEHVLKSVKIMNNRWICSYLEHASSKLKVFSKTGKFEGSLKLPIELKVGQGVPVTIGGVSGKKTDNKGFFTISSYAIPPTICTFNLNDLSTSIWKNSELKFNVSDYKTDQITYKSKDGTDVRMFVTYKNGMKRNGKNPVLLYGYGGFNTSLTPGFALSYLPFLEKGGIYVVANLRGGGEYGKKWHKAGTKLQKQNVFDDFIAAAEHLIKEEYTSKGKIAIQGGSNGGLLVAACLTQRPDLFQVAMPAVGVLDMLRYHKFTIGHAWATDYGTSEESKEMFEYLYNYSPVHNTKPQNYPATLVTTADHDDRVVPAHSYKFIAALQAAQTGRPAVLIRIDKKAGHGAGKPTDMRIQESADKLAFMMFNLGIQEF